MKVVICFCLFTIAAVSAQFVPPRLGFPFFPFPFGFPYGFPFPAAEDVYAASLGGAKVGLYGKTHPGGFPGGFPGFPGFPGAGSSDVTSASLGGAKVGLYGKEHPGRPY